MVSLNYDAYQMILVYIIQKAGYHQTSQDKLVILTSCPFPIGHPALKNEVC
jgi:hypothetical protein